MTVTCLMRFRRRLPSAVGDLEADGFSTGMLSFVYDGVCVFTVANGYVQLEFF
jgi:hypothetical protein